MRILLMVPAVPGRDAVQPRQVLEPAVTDRGPGIPPDVLQKMFDWFETHSLGSHHRGTGIGLSLVRSFVELHGGTVTIASVVGEGTTVTCAFPLGAAAKLTAADNSSVARCRIANSVHQMHEASGGVLALATPLCFTRSPGTRPGPVDQMTGWLCRQAASMVDGGQLNQVRRPVACRYFAACLN